ncbi:hypothetical protein AB0C77_13390 [Streptomyces sp. NPDC048629]|uniref:Uncharacterized protein n=1 Tax=Streptomyces solicathayae TaxID=3081768 RepID=A0ABZ0LXE8_9ACTN|nr:hypothetical protein [Streptomyces sp. HUAS YS2]WOX24202.1 hypothetical protein R2D22_23620 [Streptomyces sp. HUAS YS2]
MPASPAAAQPAGDVVRWAVFGCALGPVLLVVCGGSLGGAAGTALGLAAVTAVCRMLLCRSERGPGPARSGVRAASDFRTPRPCQDRGRISRRNARGKAREDDGFARTHP